MNTELHRVNAGLRSGSMHYEYRVTQGYVELHSCMQYGRSENVGLCSVYRV